MWENAALLAYENKEYKKAEQLLNRLAALTSLNMQQKKILLSVYFADQQWGKAASVITPAEFKGWMILMRRLFSLRLSVQGGRMPSILC
ncbi:MAG: hypothetical protein LRY51_05510 [Geovibrio sp.]|nr:hypothetical protein [Geovibrio sp.]